MKKNILTLAALALIMASCSNNETPIDETKDTPITIQSAGVAELSTRATTTPLEGTADNPVSMGVFITGGSDDKYNAANAEWIHSGGASWDTEATILYEGANSTQQIYAYYPYVAAGTAGTISVNAADQVDYLVATPTKLSSSTVSLTMNHALSKIALDVTMGTEVAGEEVVYADVELMYPSGTWNVSTNKWSDLADIPSATLTMKNNEVLVIPIESCSVLPINLKTTTGRVFKADINLEEVDGQLLPGTQYTIKLKVGQDKVELGTISAAPWENETVDEPLETL